MRATAVFARRVGPAQLRRLVRRPVPAEATARAARHAVERLGATYVKVGQFVAASPALVGDDVAAEFRGCLDSVAPVPFRAVKATVERELGQPLSALFETFDEVPLAAASMAVVHRATLPGGTPVAVKVLRPGIERKVAADLRVLLSLLRLLARQGVEAASGLLQFVNGLGAQLAEELDLRNEARSMARFGQLFAEAELGRLVVPDVHQALSSRRVLTMSLLDGVAVDDLAQVEDLGVDPRPLVEELLRSWYLGFIRDGVFHGDIHAGNLVALADGRLGVLDWGIVARLDAETHAGYRRIMEGCLGDESAWLDVAEFVMRLSPMPGEVSAADLAPALRTQIEHALLRPLGEGSLLAFPTTDTAAAPGRPTMAEDPLWSSFSGTAPEKSTSRRERRAKRRQAKEAARRVLDEGGLDSAFNHSNLLTLKTIVYLEHYGKLYLPDVALLSDEDFVRVLLG